MKRKTGICRFYLTSEGPFFLQIDALNETVALELSYTDSKLFSKHGDTLHAENISQSCS